MIDTLHQLIELVEQLHPREQAQLLALLSRRVVQYMLTSQAIDSLQPSDPWARLEAFRHDVEALGDAAPHFGAQLDADRWSWLRQLERD